MTTKTKEVTAQQRIALLKHLAGGKDLDTVATILRLPREQVLDIASNHGYPDRDKLAWGADVLTEKQNQVDSEIPVRQEEPPSRPRVVSPEPRPTPAQLTKPDEIRVLLNTAKAHESKRIQAAANRVFDQLDKLRALVDADEKKKAEKRRQEASRAQARAEVARLEKELAAAKAKLRKPRTTTGPKQSPATEGAADRPRRTPQVPRGTYECRNDGCDQVKDTPQGRSMHERFHCPQREAAAS